MQDIQQRTPEWYTARKGKLTGSSVGAAIGLNPWKTPEALIRSMVREYHGYESDFSGNIATEYGKNHEPLAVMEYLGETGNLVTECGFFVHPEHDWLGASPDGLVDDDGLIEVKTPFSQRNNNPPKFSTALEQPHYYAQMQVEMACAQKYWVDFYQWSPNGTLLERVYFNEKWWEQNLPVMRAFYEIFLIELDNPEHLQPLVVEINTLVARNLIDEYDQLTATIDDATARKKEILDRLVEAAKGRDAVLWGRKLTQIERKGSVAYAKVVKEHLPDMDLTPYTGESTRYWKLS